MTREADNPMTGSDFDWMVSNHAVWGWKAPAKASVSRFSPSALSLFGLHLPLFPKKRLILRLVKMLSLMFQTRWFGEKKEHPIISATGRGMCSQPKGMAFELCL